MISILSLVVEDYMVTTHQDLSLGWNHKVMMTTLLRLNLTRVRVQRALQSPNPAKARKVRVLQNPNPAKVRVERAPQSPNPAKTREVRVH